MTSNNIEVASPDALAELAVKTGIENDDPLSKLWALFPSADQLRSVEAGVALVTSDRPEGRDSNQPASFDVPRSLLNPLQSLPRPLSVDEVKVRRHADGAARATQAD
jgi:hypothetical protein